MVWCRGAFMPQPLLSAYPTFPPLPLAPLSGFGSNFVARWYYEEICFNVLFAFRNGSYVPKANHCLRLTYTHTDIHTRTEARSGQTGRKKRISLNKGYKERISACDGERPPRANFKIHTCWISGYADLWKESTINESTNFSVYQWWSYIKFFWL